MTKSIREDVENAGMFGVIHDPELMTKVVCMEQASLVKRMPKER